MFTYDYDLDYDGPALPIVDLTVYGAGDRKRNATVSHALVDSGADASMLPLRILQQVKARKVDWMRTRGIHGPSYVVDIYEVDIELAGHIVPGVYVAADRFNQNAIMGRDVLNQFIVTLNGLASMVEISR